MVPMRELIIEASRIDTSLGPIAPSEDGEVSCSDRSDI